MHDYRQCCPGQAAKHHRCQRELLLPDPYDMKLLLWLISAGFEFSSFSFFSFQLHLEIDNLPELNKPYVCAFTAMGKTITTNASKVDDASIKCPTPRNDLLPVLNHGQRELLDAGSTFLCFFPSLALFSRGCLLIFYIFLSSYSSLAFRLLHGSPVAEVCRWPGLRRDEFHLFQLQHVRFVHVVCVEFF